VGERRRGEEEQGGGGGINIRVQTYNFEREIMLRTNRERKTG